MQCFRVINPVPSAIADSCDTLNPQCYVKRRVLSLTAAVDISAAMLQCLPNLKQSVSVKNYSEIISTLLVLLISLRLRWTLPFSFTLFFFFQLVLHKSQKTPFLSCHTKLMPTLLLENNMKMKEWKWLHRAWSLCHFKGMEASIFST